MRFAIAYGKDDPAGNNIVEQIKKIGFAPQIPIIELKKHPIYSENIDKLPEFKNRCKTWRKTRNNLQYISTSSKISFSKPK